MNTIIMVSMMFGQIVGVAGYGSWEECQARAFQVNGQAQGQIVAACTYDESLGPWEYVNEDTIKLEE